MSRLKEFLRRVPDLGTQTPNGLVPYLAFYLTDDDPEVVLNPKSLGDVFDEARIKQPPRIYDVLRRSKQFVPVRGGGFRLSHDASERISESLLPSSSSHPSGGHPVQTDGSRVEHLPATAKPSTSDNARDLFVVYGQDEKLRKELFSFLRAVGLNPLEFEEIVHRTGKTSPFTLEVVQKGFQDCRACVVLLSPDEEVVLRADLGDPSKPRLIEFQARPNVILEAGMALALHPDRTILVKVGDVRRMSDLDGKQYITLGNNVACRHKLVGRLRLAGCAVSTNGEDWLENNYNFVPTRNSKD